MKYLANFFETLPKTFSLSFHMRNFDMCIWCIYTLFKNSPPLFYHMWDIRNIYFQKCFLIRRLAFIKLFYLKRFIWCFCHCNISTSINKGFWRFCFAFCQKHWIDLQQVRNQWLAGKFPIFLYFTNTITSLSICTGKYCPMSKLAEIAAMT